MISSACFCAVFETAHAHYDCSPEDISILGFTFRIPPDWRSDILNSRQLRVHIYYPDRPRTLLLPASAYTLTVETEERYDLLMRMETASPDYAHAVRSLMEDISSYTKMKSELDMSEVSKIRTGYPAEQEQDFPASFTDQFFAWMSSVHPDSGWADQDYSAALCLTDPRMVESYVTLPEHAFPAPYRKLAHPIMNHIHTLYFGSMTCPFLFPDKDLLLTAFNKATRENLHAVLSLPPVMPSDFERIRHLLEQLIPHLPALPEFSVNDWGLLRYVHTRYPSAVIELGPLLNRETRDVRMTYLHRNTPGESSLHAPIWQKLISDLGVTRLSAQCHEQAQRPLPLPFSLYLPFFQMNTSLQCTLRSALECGTRGGQPKDRTCSSMPCSSSVFLYPDFLHMVGLQNSLYGYDRKALSDFSYVRTMMGDTCDRIVLQLFQ